VIAKDQNRITALAEGWEAGPQQLLVEIAETVRGTPELVENLAALPDPRNSEFRDADLAAVLPNDSFLRYIMKAMANASLLMAINYAPRRDLDWARDIVAHVPSESSLDRAMTAVHWLAVHHNYQPPQRKSPRSAS
jgi:hypothetical protein